MSVVAEPGNALVRDALRRVTLVAWISAGAGATVTFLAVGFFIPLVVEPSDGMKIGLFNGPMVIAFGTVFGLVRHRVFRRHLRAALRWLRDEREPADEEHHLTLRLAASAVKGDALGWAIGAVLFPVLNGLIFSWALAPMIAATIWLGGETTSAVSYLLHERALRPITARALSARPPGATVHPGVRLRLAMAWLLGTGVPLVGLFVVGIVGTFGSPHHSKYVGAAVLFLAVVATCAGFLATTLAARAIADPLTAVRIGIDRIAEGDLEVSVRVDDGSEIGQLQAGFNRMVEGLRERRRIRDLFGRHVGEEVAQSALSAGVRLGGEEREVAALYIDLVGSTSLALALPPTDVVALLNHFFRMVVEVVESCGGFVNKFEGDAALCVFGAPVACADPAGDALRAARRLADRLCTELAEVDFGIGVSAGVAVAGNIGAEHRFEYTVIGDPVNEAARLAEIAKRRPERVLTSSAALERAGMNEAEAWSLTGAEVLRGRLAPTQLAHPLRRAEPVAGD